MSSVSATMTRPPPPSHKRSERAITREVQAAEAKTHLPRLLDDVERRETIIITHHGRPTARIVPEPHRRQQEIDRALADIQEPRKHTGKISIDEILGWRHEGQILMAFVIDASIVTAWAFEETSATGAPPRSSTALKTTQTAVPTNHRRSIPRRRFRFPPGDACISSVYYRHLAHGSSPCLKAGSAQRLAWLQEGSLTRPGTA